MNPAAVAHLSRASRVSKVVKAALGKNLLNDESPVLDLYDLEGLRGRFREVQEALPSWNHAFAIKTNPIRGVMLEAKKCGLGAEAASIGELEHALQLGFDRSKIVYDSPVKTKAHLKHALNAGVVINLDNLEEVEKVNEILPDLNVDVTGKIGMRVNPNVGAGKIAMSSTAGKSSKFGLPMTGEFEEEVIKIILDNSWIQGLHQHIGSQGISLDQLTLGVERLVKLGIARKINDLAGNKQIKYIDVGGGIPTDYESDDEKVAFAEYAKLVTDRVPNLAEFSFHSEFGRSLVTKYAFSVSKVETVKTWGDRITVLTHFGSNQFLREVYLPDTWFHRMSVLDKNGDPKTGDFIEQDVGGPLCFQGDYLAKARALPEIKPGDYIVMHDIGGYTYALYSRFNSIQFEAKVDEIGGGSLKAPAVYGYDESHNFYEYKSRESLAETLSFWGHREPKNI